MGAHIFPRVSVEVVLVLDADELVVAGLVARAVAVVEERVRLPPASRPDVSYKRAKYRGIQMGASQVARML